MGLTEAELDEIKEDLHFFLDEFGSTAAVRRKLRQQDKYIKRLGRSVQRSDSRDEEDAQELSEPSDAEADVVDKIQADIEFFLQTFGSTRAVRERLESQRKEIMGLQRTARWMEERERKRKKAADSRVDDETLGAGKDDESTSTQSTSLVRSESDERGPPLGDLVVGTYAEMLDEFPPVVAVISRKRSPAASKTIKSKRQRADVAGYGLHIQATTASSDSCSTGSPAVGSTPKHQSTESPRKCKVRDCGKPQGKGGYCCDHDLDSYCSSRQSDHVALPGTPKHHKVCKVPSCMKWVKRHPLYCVNHQDWLGTEATGAESVRSPRPTSTGQQDSRSHTTCKIHGCMKWVSKLNSIYCTTHTRAPTETSSLDLHERTSFSSGKESPHHNAAAHLTSTPTSKHQRPLCERAGCTQKAKRHGLCKAHRRELKLKAHCVTPSERQAFTLTDQE